MTESTLTQKAPARKRRARGTAPPQPIAPEPDALADAQSLTFEWAAGDGTDFVLEIAREAAFQDVVARVPTGTSTSVTVYDLFRPDGKRYFWRVASGAGDAGETRAFVAASYQQASTGTSGFPAAATGSPSAPAATARELAPPIEPPYRTGETSSTTALAVVLLMVLSFFVTVGILYTITLGM